MILLDTSGLLAALFPDQRFHTEATQALSSSTGPFLLSPFVLAELDSLVSKLAGVEVALELLAEVERGAYSLESFSDRDVGRARLVVEQYRELEIGLADASIVVLAERYSVTDLLTLDERHFRVVQGPNGPFRLLPADCGDL